MHLSANRQTEREAGINTRTWVSLQPCFLSDCFCFFVLFYCLFSLVCLLFFYLVFGFFFFFFRQTLIGRNLRMLLRSLKTPSSSTCRLFCFLLLLQTPRFSLPLITGKIKGIARLHNDTSRRPPCVKSTQTPGYFVCRVSVFIQPGSALKSKSGMWCELMRWSTTDCVKQAIYLPVWWMITGKKKCLLHLHVFFICFHL